MFYQQSQLLTAVGSSWPMAPLVHAEPAPNCPRCHSTNTKFCYYNNYSLSQPRYFCKGCRRYWTKGGSLRNVPVGGGCRKKRRSAKSARSRDQNHQPQASLRPDLALDGIASGKNCSPSTCADNLAAPIASSIDLAELYAKYLNPGGQELLSANQASQGERKDFADCHLQRLAEPMVETLATNVPTVCTSDKPEFTMDAIVTYQSSQSIQFAGASEFFDSSSTVDSSFTWARSIEEFGSWNSIDSLVPYDQNLMGNDWNPYALNKDFTRQQKVVKITKAIIVPSERPLMPPQ